MELKDIMEILFNVFYLIIIWFLVIKMYKNMNIVDSKGFKVAKLLALAFTFLAIGDTGHVGFRVLAYLRGGLGENAQLLGIGKLMTSITVTIFYMILVEIWKARFNIKYHNSIFLLYICGLIRIIVLFLPGNQWSSSIAPFNYEMYRNIPLIILGLGTATLIYKYSKKANDKVFELFSIMIFISYAFYIPVIFLARFIPLIGLLMIPKTVAYLIAAIIAYRGIFKINN